MKSYYIIYQGDIEKVLQENNINEYMILNTLLVVIYVSEDFNEDILNQHIEIAWWGTALPMNSLINITDNLANGENVTVSTGTDYIYKNPYLDLSGKGILVAIIDSGVNYLHPDLIYDNGRSKIVSLWDQESNKGNTPEGYIFGSEFTNEDLNNAIRNNDATLSVDEIGTGTLAAGIVAGSGKQNQQYRGIATESELVVVKLRTFKDTYAKGKINYLNSDFFAALKYVIDVATRYNRPLIINMTVGAMSDATIETSLIDTFYSLSRAGTVIVTGAGNEGNTDIHYAGRFTSLDETNDVIIQVGEQDNIDIAISTNGPDKISAQLISPSGQAEYKVEYSPENPVYRGRFGIENTSFTMRFIYPWIASGKQRLEISLKDVKPGIWTLRLSPQFIVKGEYDIYLPNKNLIAEDTRFIDPESVATISMYAAGRDYITVGAYNDQIDSVWIGSSKGPIRGVGIKPDIIAPGVDIISTFKNNEYNTGTGTGISSSIVSGVLALIMEFLIQQETSPTLSLYPQVLKTYLMLGARKKEIYTYPNISEGYGILDLQRTIEEISNNL